MLLNDMMLPEKIKRGISILENYGFLQTGERGVMINAAPGDAIFVEKSGNTITITYDTELHFYMALARSMGMIEGVHPIDIKAEKLGLMLDCSRNAVPKPDMLKRLICLLVLAGYNYLELYMEDVYELPDEPYFGYKRGRFSADELKEIVAFAEFFEFEMVPCIQTLAHLKHLANWWDYYIHMDLEDILMVGDEKTYNLIRKSLRFCKEVFRTSRINIGCDEAFRLGRGRYTDTFGYKSKHEVYIEHLAKVFEMCKEEGLNPEFWGDGLYREGFDISTERIQSLFDGTQTPVVWSYHDQVGDETRENLQKLKNYAGHVKYAGGLLKWHGYAPNNRLSKKIIDVLVDVAEECDVTDVLMTAWGDDGDECSVFAVIPAMWFAAHKIYPCDVDISTVIEQLTGYTCEEWEESDSLNHVIPHNNRLNNAAKYMLSNDFLIGLLDYNIPEHSGEVYRELLAKFLHLAERNSYFAYIFQSYASLCKVLIRKATFSKRMYKAYQEKDYATMKNMVAELEDIKKDFQKFYDVYRKQWFSENKGFGFEVIDVRIGGMIGRIDTVKIMVNDYLEGRVDKIYELEEERIEYFCGRRTGDEVYAPLHGLWSTAYTVNNI
jgi:hypothetical protein